MGRVKDRAVDADALVVPAVRRLHLRHAAETDADAACHWRFQRHIAWHLPFLSDFGQGM